MLQIGEEERKNITQHIKHIVRQRHALL